MSIAQEIKSRLDIVDVISEYVDLKKSGRNLAGFCPFHTNTRTPAFYVSPERQSWHCFGACAEGGDVYSFLMKKEGWDFRETLEQMARRTGIDLPAYKPKSAEQQSAEDKLGALMTLAADYYHKLFLTAPQASYARDYVEKRALSAETITTFQIGYALQSWDACRNHFEEQGYSRDDLLNVGLLTFNEEKDSTYDRFRHRLMFPIRNLDGQVVGFGARTLEADGIPKYLNSPQTPLFDKSHILYGLDAAKRHVRDANEAIIVEGYMDVIRAHQAGFHNVIAQMGTALTETQLTLLKRYTKRFVIALDADAAGVQATMRSLEVARGTLDRDFDIQFDARGLVRNEGRLKADIRIVTMPEGKDPDDIIRHDPAQWPALVSQAKPVVEYVIDTVSADVDLNDPKAKSDAAKKVIPLIKDIADAVERDHWLQRLADTIEVDPQALRKYAAKSGKSRPKTVAREQKRERPSATLSRNVKAPLAVDKLEAHFLREVLASPPLLAQVDALLRQARQPAVRGDDFSATEDQALFAQLAQHTPQAGDTATLLNTLYATIDDYLISRIQSLLTLPHTDDMQLEQLPPQLTLSVLNWRLDKIKRQLDEVKQTMDAENERERLETCQMLTMIMLSIHQAKHQLSVQGQRDG